MDTLIHITGKKRLKIPNINRVFAFGGFGGFFLLPLFCMQVVNSAISRAVFDICMQKIAFLVHKCRVEEMYVCFIQKYSVIFFLQGIVRF